MKVSPSDIDKLNQIRLSDDRSFQYLADEIGLPMRTLYRLLKKQQTDCYDRTLHKIHAFLSKYARDARKKHKTDDATV